MPTADVRRILETGYLVVLDEAYFEFADADGQGFESMIGEVASYPNLVVLRTFSKWAGLAGLADRLRRFPARGLAAPLEAEAAVQRQRRGAGRDAGRARRQGPPARHGQEDRRRAQPLLVELPKTRIVRPYPTRSNFILCEIDGMDGRALTDRLADEGILVRYYNTPRLRSCVRISVGRPSRTTCC